ncbi:helix-turn-helix transcriptional regulator [Lichenihabitans psoromatis]|uniref:helix-turn-helix transcriptional regulator n=1 Tax=Lichenihabitans psoromatis TaxID=2528642 RepID=UPI0010384D83|nr:hypothetical protein [Lichenihabitans psoromatis]
MTLRTTLNEPMAPPPFVPLDSVPAEYARNRVLDSQQAADFLNLSLPHFRRLYRLGKVPRPIKITERKLGWPFGLLNDFVASRTKAREAA